MKALYYLVAYLSVTGDPRPVVPSELHGLSALECEAARDAFTFHVNYINSLPQLTHGKPGTAAHPVGTLYNYSSRCVLEGYPPQ